MKLNELVRTLDTWISNEERAVLKRIDGLQPVSVFTSNELFSFVHF
jgi:hypothetical protein